MFAGATLEAATIISAVAVMLHYDNGAAIFSGIALAVALRAAKSEPTNSDEGV